MERIFETQSAGYGQMMLGVARTTKAKVSGVFTALRLPKIVVSILTWALLLSIGLMLAGLIAFAAFIYFMLTSSGQKSKDGELHEDGLGNWVGDLYAHEDPSSVHYDPTQDPFLANGPGWHVSKAWEELHGRRN